MQLQAGWRRYRITRTRCRSTSTTSWHRSVIPTDNLLLWSIAIEIDSPDAPLRVRLSILIYLLKMANSSASQRFVKKLKELKTGVLKVEKMAELYTIQLRTGCFCNQGACQAYLTLSDEQVIYNYKVTNSNHEQLCYKQYCSLAVNDVVTSVT